MEQIILFTFLILFPFGQIIKIGIVNPIDIVVGAGALWAILKKNKHPSVFKYFNNFLYVVSFSYIVSIFLIKEIDLVYGLLYLVRLVAYFYFFTLVSNFKNKKLLLNSLLSLSIFSAIFGWIQYFLYPDVRALIYYGWDDHLYRMVGTFLDPTFLGLILVLGSILAFYQKKYLAFGFLAFSILFTYSRASYLALLIPSFFVFKKLKYYLLFVICLLIIVIFLPKKAGEGVRLERTSSIVARLESYGATFSVFKESPLFGVGFNNICLAKDKNFSSHSCSGSESSLLFLLATTGVVGFVSFVYFVFKVGGSLSRNSTFYILHSTFIAIFVHSLFSNSLFYPWIMGYLMILLAITLKREVKT
ncbi:MAG: O-antigen ligase family protein [Patescibacteria group bacterium]